MALMSSCEPLRHKKTNQSAIYPFTQSNPYKVHTYKMVNGAIIRHLHWFRERDWTHIIISSCGITSSAMQLCSGISNIPPQCKKSMHDTKVHCAIRLKLIKARSSLIYVHFIKWLHLTNVHQWWLLTRRTKQNDGPKFFGSGTDQNNARTSNRY